MDLAGPWRHAHRALDVASGRLSLDDAQFGRRSTLVTIPLSEIRETHKNLGRVANARGPAGRPAWGRVSTTSGFSAIRPLLYPHAWVARAVRARLLLGHPAWTPGGAAPLH